MFRILMISFVISSGLSAAPPLYKLWITTRDGKIAEREADFLSRKLPAIDVVFLTHAARYKKTPELPLPVCQIREYFLISPGDELLSIGCIEPSQEGQAVTQVSQVISRYEADLRAGRNPTILAKLPRY